MFKKLSVVFLMACFVLQGCAGKTPNPVQQYTMHDNQLSCDMINQEISENQNQIMSLVPKSQKTGKNVGLGVAGAFLLVPWFFMDFSDAERIEIQAYQNRNQRLRALHSSKQCDVANLPQEIKFQEPPKKSKRHRGNNN